MRRFLDRRRPPIDGRGRRRFYLGVEQVEARVLLATFAVTNLQDSGPGTLRQAILEANANEGVVDLITFEIPGAGPHTIQPETALPVITDPVIIAGPEGSGPESLPLIALDGSDAGTADGLVITAGGSTVRALTITRFEGMAIRLTGGGGNLIEGNVLGLAAGEGRGNARDGIHIENSLANTIGGSTPEARNIISGNGGVGVSIQGVGSVVNHIQGNLIGLGGDGHSASGNGGDGIRILNGANNLIGGNGLERNVISASGGNAIHLIGDQATGNLILGNFLGTDASGLGRLDPETSTNRLANDQDGIAIRFAFDNVIGGPGPGEGNIIVGSRGAGIRLFAFSTGNLVQGNRIGLDASGLPLANVVDGVHLSEVAANTIGGVATGEGNLISGNIGDGVLITRSPGNLVLGNQIGLSSDGNGRQGNGGDGIRVLDGANNTIGGNGPARNVISANSGNGIQLIGDQATGNLVLGNLVGTDASGQGRHGLSSFANGENGIDITFAFDNVIGGAGSGEGNVVVGSRGFGIRLFAFSTGNRILGNRIGLDASGLPFANVLGGLFLSEVAANTIGGEVAGTGNLISGNDGDGALIIGSLSNRIEGNFIGTDPFSNEGLGNQGHGIVLRDSTNNTIGGATLAARNVISANRGQGIHLLGAGTRDTVILSNFIGTDAGGTLPLGNALGGVLIDASPGNSILGTPMAPALISGNQGHGISILGASAEGNRIQGARVGTEVSGTQALGNLGDGLRIEGATDTTIGNPAGNTDPGLAESARNVFSGNLAAGVELVGFVAGVVLRGNFIGTDAAGRAPLGNEIGVHLNNVDHVQIGGTGPFDGNVISGNRSMGIQVFSVEDRARGNGIAGNFIGTDADGLRSLGGQPIGVFLNNTPANTIGGSEPGARNVISGNNIAGVHILGQPASSNAVVGNFIGTDVNGDRAITLGDINSFDLAFRQDVGVLLNDAPGNLVVDNVVSGNYVGIQIVGGHAARNVVSANFIGTDLGGQRASFGPADSSRALGNFLGVFLTGASGNTIGGTSPGAGNVISGNLSVGVMFLGALATRNLLSNNRIGADLNGNQPLPNGTGVFIEGSRPGPADPTEPRRRVGPGASIRANTIEDNLIVHNRLVGVYIFGGASGNAVRRNTIRSNGSYGILVYNSAENANTIDIPRSGPQGNRITGSGIASFREFTGRVEPEMQETGEVPLIPGGSGRGRGRSPGSS